jgi:hypothetical protein
MQRSLVDHGEFITTKENFEAWLAREEGNLEDSAGFGDERSMKEKLDTVDVS